MTTTGYLSIGGARLYAEEAGAGEPVLLLHGGFCSLESLRPQADALAADHRVLAFERAGHGRSADVDGPFHYARGVEDALEYLDARGVGPVHVVGYSDGAIIGLLLALDHPERVRSLVAISANISTDAFPPADPATEAEPSAESAASAAEPDRYERWYAELSPDGPGHAPVVLEKLVAMWTSEPDIDPAELARISAPTLIVAADRDTIRLDHTLLIASSIPGAQLCIVPGTTHALVDEKPGFVSAVLREFLASAEAVSAS